MAKKIAFTPQYRITNSIASALMRIQACQQAVSMLPITPMLLAKLRETSKYQTIHYSTMIEGNRLTERQVVQVIQQNHVIPGRERDEKEVKGYYAALEAVQKYVGQNEPVSEELIQKLHALVLFAGKDKVTPSPYRTNQNVIKESGTGRIVYLPPEAHDVPLLMAGLVSWLHDKKNIVPTPILAALAHYQFATIHPYLDGNGRTARLLATLIIHQGGFDLKGIYSLDEYYARDIHAYYNALTVGPFYNYYMGREVADPTSLKLCRDSYAKALEELRWADLTGWVEYFCEGMADAFERVQKSAQKEALLSPVDHTLLLRELTEPQRKVVQLFQDHSSITNAQIVDLLGIAERTARNWCTQWVEMGFLQIAQASRKARTYTLGKKFLPLVNA